jgi:23S rRNA (uracil1939-C5)-methyltransferase
MQTLEILIEQLGVNGEGVGRLSGYTIFVPGALPKEKVSVELIERKKTYAKAKLLKRLTPSPHRTTPHCPHFGKCGGCQLMHLEYPEQLKAKRQRVVDALERIGKLNSFEVLPCHPSPLALGYRNKIQLPEGKGLFAYNSHEIVEVDHCYIHCDLGEKALAEIRPLLSRLPKGELRHLLIKTAVQTQEVLVTLVTTQENPAHLLEIAKQIIRASPKIKGVVQNINPSTNNTILSRKFKTLIGEPCIFESILGLSFKVSSASFFQVNPMQAEILYKKTLELAALSSKETVLDAFCGVGTISLLAASHAKKVIGIECVREAICDAEDNAQRNRIGNVQFHCGQAESLISTLGAIDVAILNPPRKGCESSFLKELAEKRPSRILYISCDPATLARDLAYLTSQGYEPDFIQPFDMFPQTAHVECLVRLIRR